MGVVKQPARIPVPCPKCKGTVAVVSSAKVSKAAAFSPWRGWALATIVEQAAQVLDLYCPTCEAEHADSPRAPKPSLPSLGL
jgi:hypothetical protein